MSLRTALNGIWLGEKFLLAFKLQPQSIRNLHYLGNYAAYSVNSLPTFRDNLSVLSAIVTKLGLIGCPKTSVKNWYYTSRKSKEERGSQKIFCP